MTSPVSGGFQFTPATGLNDTTAYPTTPANETANRQQFMDLYWQLMNEMNNPTFSAAAFTQYNKLINGGFAVNQRGVSGTVTLSAGQYGHDRWKAGASGCTYTFSTVNNVTTITITAGSLVQVIEGINLVSGTYTLSWTGTAQGKIGAGAFGASAITGAATGGTNLSIEFNLGTLSNVMFNPGDQKLPFQPRSYAEELALCQRYCQVIYDETNGEVNVGMGFAATSTIALILCNLITEMRVQPSLVVTAGDWKITDGGAPTICTGITMQTSQNSRKTPMLRVAVASGLTANRPYALSANSAANKRFIFDAEL